MNKKYAIILAVLVIIASQLACGGPDLVCPHGPESCYNPDLGAPADVQQSNPAPASQPCANACGLTSPVTEIEQTIIDAVDSDPSDNVLH